MDMEREDTECTFVAGILRDHARIRLIQKDFTPRLFESSFYRDVAGFCLGHLDKGKTVNVDQLARHFEGKQPGLGERFRELAALDPSVAEWREAVAKLVGMASDSGKSAPARDLGTAEPPSDPSHPLNAPAAENSYTSEGEQDPKTEGGGKASPLRPSDPLRELEAKLTNYDAEQALLAAVLTNEAVYSRVAGIVKPEDFADPLHGRIFWACGELVAKGKRPNPVTLKNMFDQDGALKEIGGAQYLIDLALSVVTVLGAEDFAHQVADLAGRRHTLDVLEKTKARLLDFTLDSSQLVAEAMHRLPQGMGGSSSRIRTKRQVREEIARYVDRPGIFYPTGIPGLDKILGGGFYAGKLYGLGARFKAGKSALSGSISHALNERNTMHGLVALEMTDMEVEMRDVARDLQVNSLRLMKGAAAEYPVGGDRVVKTIADINDATVYFSEPGATFDEIRAFVLQAISRYKITGFILDYHQLISQVDEGTEERHLRMTAQTLAKMCRQFGLWCLLVLQLNQEGNARGGEGIKLACDAYMVLHREKGSDGAHVELEIVRYKEAEVWGSPTVPGLKMDPHGPHFRDETAGPAENEVPSLF